MTCKYYNAKLNICKIGEYGGNPTVKDCQACARYQGGLRGAGDVVARATKLVRIKPCGGCKKRQALLNRLIPFGKKPNA